MRRAFGVTPALLLSAAAVFIACGGDEPAATPAPSGAGSGGKAGAAGAGAGAAGSAGKATAGAAGASTAGAAGASATTCKVPGDCVVPATTPAGCAEAACDAGLCKLKAKDADGDGLRALLCKAADGTATIELGTDCNDGNKDVLPGAWDGPAADGKPNRCGDGIDQDCSGADGDSKGTKGESCTCTPGDVQDCDQDEGGKPIVFPGGAPVGACARGKRTCVVDAITKAAVFTACVGAKGPVKEICNGGIDDDCDGKADMADSEPPLNTATWSYDGDSDGFVKDATYRIEWCGDEKPTVCPTGQATCDKAKWKLLNLPSGDCDDADEKARLGGAELCNGDGKDYNCNGKANTPGQIAGDCACKEGDQVACAPSDKTYPASATKPSDKYPLPASLDLQSGNLLGECRWGTKECINGQWTTCHDGTGAQASENCSQADKKDYNCNGVPNQNPDDSATADCSCTTGQTRACGTCGKGTEACTAGAWGNCQGDDVPLTYCPDADGDSVCAAGCGPECPGADHTGKKLKSDCDQGGTTVDCQDNDASISPRSIEKCSAVDEDCDGDAYGSYPVPGTPCNNGKQGSCYKDGGSICTMPIASGCDAGDWPDAPTDAYVEVPLHGSYDRNCDGILRRTKGVLAPIATGPLPSGKSCTSGQQWKTQCDTYRPSGSTLFFIYLACDTEPVSVINQGEDYLKVTTPSVPRISKCGSPYLLVTCNYNGNAYGGQQYNMQCN